MVAKSNAITISGEISASGFSPNELPYAADVFLKRTGLPAAETLSLRQRKELQRFIELAESNISKHDFGVSQMAYALSLTERTLHRKLKSLTGLRPVDFIREIKLHHAKMLCDAMEVNTSKELARKLGYTNAGYLNKLYKNKFGQSPLQD